MTALISHIHMSSTKRYEESAFMATCVLEPSALLGKPAVILFTTNVKQI
jgi:hypothetical protein